MGLDEKFFLLKKLLKQYGRVAIAFSGGLDSSFLLHTALQVLGRDHVLALTVDYPYIHRSSIQEAIETASSMGAQHIIIRDSSVMNEIEIAMNLESRCYKCKKRMMQLLKQAALKTGFTILMDGTNKSDLAENRPGIKALKEEGVISPLAAAGLSRQDIIKLTKRQGLPFWNKPPNTCLLTRLPRGYMALEEDLRKIEEVEETLRAHLGKTIILRARHHGDLIRIETERKELLHIVNLILENHELITKLKSMGYSFITVDLEGYKESKNT